MHPNYHSTCSTWKNHCFQIDQGYKMNGSTTKTIVMKKSKYILALNMQVMTTENRSQLSTLKITNNLPRLFLRPILVESSFMVKTY